MDLATAKNYLETTLGEQDTQKLTPAYKTQLINFAQQDVQQNIIPLNIKGFNKVAYLSGFYFAAPTDMLASPNAIEDLLVSTGEKATVLAITSDTGVITITALIPGTAQNGWVLTLSDGGTAGEVVVNITAKTILCRVDLGTTTNQQVIDYLNGDGAFSSFFIATTSVAGEALTDDGNIVFDATASGTGTGYVPTRELSVKDRNRDENNVYRAPEDTDPAYLRHGNSGGTQYIECLPNTITYSKMYYYYKLADLSASTDELGIPAEYQELVMLRAITKAYQFLEKQAQSQDERLDYEKKRADYEKAYMDVYSSKKVSLTSMQSSDN